METIYLELLVFLCFPVFLKVEADPEPLAIRPPYIERGWFDLEQSSLHVWEAGTLSCFKIKLKTPALRTFVVSNSVATVII